jgi:hypothetical protein
MTDFRIKFLGLAAVASLFAGVSYGQTLGCPAQTTAAFPNLYVAIEAGVNPSINGNPATAAPASPLLLRTEGTTELVSDLVVQNCTSSSNAATAQVVVFMSQPVTSKVINAAATPPTTEATLLVTPCTSVAPGVAGNTCNANSTTSAYAGTVSGNTVTFTNVSFPATFNLEVADIRVNATGTGATSSPVPVTESLFAGFNGQSTISLSSVVVGQALQSLVTPAFTLSNNLPIVNNLVICTGNTVSPATGLANTTLGFNITIAEILGGFFKSGLTSTGTPGTVPATEYGEYVNTGSGAGVPTSGTRVQIALNNVPAAATVYVPLTIVSAGAAMQLTTSATGGFSQVTASTTAGIPANTWAALTPSSGTVTAVYEVTTANPAAINNFNNIPVYITFKANSVTAAQITVLESYAPNGTTQIPNFAASTATPLSGPNITACVSNLLFPFVTSQLGFDTGIALSNASADPFGAFGAVPSGTTAPAGACTLNYYGAGAPSPSAVATPSIASGTTYAFVNSSVAPGFQGYIIAQCPFVGGHGFGFVTNLGSAGNSAVAQGYTALSLPAANSSGTKRIAAPTEGLGQ